MFIDQKNASRAFTLTEIAIVLGIIGLILGAIWSTYNMVHINYLISTTLYQTTTLARNIQALYPDGAFASSYSPGQDLRLELARAGAIPPQMLGNFSWWEPSDVWNNYVFIEVSTDLSHFQIRTENIPSGLCTRLMMAMTRAGVSAIMDSSGNWQPPSTITVHSICPNAPATPQLILQFTLMPFTN